MDKLKLALNQSVNLLENSYDTLPWDNIDFYANYLAQTFYYVRHSTRLLATSAGRLSYENQQMLHLRFLKHLGEEANHERLALNDLKFLGYKIEDFKEMNSTRFFYEPQYFKIEHIDPLALMGYILYLEVLAQHICPPLSKKLTTLYGKKASTFLLVHGEEDPHHVEEAQKLLATLPPASIAIITENLLQSSEAFNMMFKELVITTEVNKWKKSA
ncbi:MAG: iron-containing redox enzyme family protein [Bdellovibrionales bacterium]|nr:iron-containing redox enzyme family protein [Bdellovibrionales bacterium]